MRASPVPPLLAVVVTAGSTAAVALAAAPPASAATPPACQTKVANALALERDPENVSFWLSNDGGAVVTCRDVNGDGRKDGLFIMLGGGSGGAFSGGIITDDGAGTTPVLRAWVKQGSRMGVGFRRGLPAFAWPIYRRGDPNCCASGGWKIRKFRPSGTSFTALKTQRLRSQSYPLKKRP